MSLSLICPCRGLVQYCTSVLAPLIIDLGTRTTLPSFNSCHPPSSRTFHKHCTSDLCEIDFANCVRTAILFEEQGGHARRPRPDGRRGPRLGALRVGSPDGVAGHRPHRRSARRDRRGQLCLRLLPAPGQGSQVIWRLGCRHRGHRRHRESLQCGAGEERCVRCAGAPPRAPARSAAGCATETALPAVRLPPLPPSLPQASTW